MSIYIIDSETGEEVIDGKQVMKKERCFVEASTIAGAIALRPERGTREIVCVQRVGNIIAREVGGVKTEGVK